MTIRRYKYKLTLEVEDHGRRVYESSYESDCQDDLASSLVCDFTKRATNILNSPPMLNDMLQPIKNDWLHVLGIILDDYHYVEPLRHCLILTIDLDKLGAEGKKARDRIRKWAKTQNMTCIPESDPDEEPHEET